MLPSHGAKSFSVLKYTQKSKHFSVAPQKAQRKMIIICDGCVMLWKCWHRVLFIEMRFCLSRYQNDNTYNCNRPSLVTHTNCILSYVFLQHWNGDKNVDFFACLLQKPKHIYENTVYLTHPNWMSAVANCFRFFDEISLKNNLCTLLRGYFIFNTLFPNEMKWRKKHVNCFVSTLSYRTIFRIV